MKANAFVIFEYDENEETLITFIYPNMDQDLKLVISETAQYLITSSSTLSLFTYFKNQWLYFEAERNTEKTDVVRLYGICVTSFDFFPKKYLSFASLLSKIALLTTSPPKVLRTLLAVQAEGHFSQNGINFSVDDYPEDFTENTNFDSFLDRAGQYIGVLWQALVGGKSIAIYSPDVSILQSVMEPILCLCLPGRRQLLPLVLEKSITQTTAAQDIPLSIWCSSDLTILNGKFDFILDLSSRSVKYSTSFSKEAGKSSLLEILKKKINDATSSEGNVVQAMISFNEIILNTLNQIKAAQGELTIQAINSFQLSSDQKMILSSIVNSGVFKLN